MGSGAGSLLHRREGVGKGGICANEIDVYWRTIKPFPEVSCRKGKERAKTTGRKNLDFLLKAVSAGKERNRLLKHLSSSVQNSDIQHAGLRCNKFVYAPSSSFRNLSPDRVVFLVCVYRDRLHTVDCIRSQRTIKTCGSLETFRFACLLHKTKTWKKKKKNRKTMQK